MELNYIPAESAVRQPAIEVGVTTVYLRRNFVKTDCPSPDNRETTTIWTYEEAQLTKDEALFVLAEQNSSLTKAVEDADGMNVDQEYRLTLLELGLSEA